MGTYILQSVSRLFTKLTRVDPIHDKFIQICRLSYYTRTENVTKELPTENDDFEEVKIPVPWGHISGKWWGPKSVQPIIAIHGWQDNAGTFDNLAPLLKNKQISVLCIDLPGHGFSSPLGPGQFYYLFWDGVHYVRRIVKYFNWKDITLMGHSLGGGISFLYAAIFPDDVEKFISIDMSGPVVMSEERRRRTEGPGLDAFLRYEALTEQLTYDYTESVNTLLAAHKGSLTEETAVIMLKRGMVPTQNDPDKYVFTRDPRIKTASLGSFSEELVHSYASRIKSKVLNIKAVPGIGFDEEKYQSVLDAMAQTAKVERVRLEGTHHIHLNDPQPVFDHVHKFLIS